MLQVCLTLGGLRMGYASGPIAIREGAKKRNKSSKIATDADASVGFVRAPRGPRPSDDLGGTVPARIQVVQGPTAAKSEQVRRQQYEQNEDFEIHHWLFPCASGFTLSSRPEIGDASAPCLVTIPSARRLAAPMRSTNSVVIAFFFVRLRAAFRMEYIVTGLSHREKKRPALRGNAGRVPSRLDPRPAAQRSKLLRCA